MSFQGLFSVRPTKKEDESFILATFLRGLYYGNTWFNLIPKQIFMENYGPIATKLIKSTKVMITVACLPDDPDVILGYSILSTDASIVHWVFVKKIWRNKGIGTALVPAEPSAVTHLTDAGKDLLERKYKTAIFNPFQL